MLLSKHSARGIPGLFRRRAHALAMGACLAVASMAQAAAGSGPDFVGIHLERGQAYLDKGEYAQAILEFEQVLQFDNLPPGLKEQAEIYAEAARNRNAGNPLSSFGYAEVGGGYYHENTTRTTEPGAAQRSAFGKVRVGGGLGYLLGDGLSLDGTLDYRYRKYDDSARREICRRACTSNIAEGQAVLIRYLDSKTGNVGGKPTAQDR